MSAMPTLWRTRFERLKKFGFAAMLGLIILIGSLLANSGVFQIIMLVVGFLAIVPGFLYFFAYTIWHWKARYRGSHSDLWGVLLLIETSGWFKLVYLFRHILPDARQSGRYAVPDSALRPSSDTESGCA